MSWMIEAYIRRDAMHDRVLAVTSVATSTRGVITHEDEGADGSPVICLSIEFGQEADAIAAMKQIQEHGIHVEGPCDY